MDIACANEQMDEVLMETIELDSEYLKRSVRIDFYQPAKIESHTSTDVLLVNDGQDLEEMGIMQQLHAMFAANQLRPLLVVGIHSSENRKEEYGMSVGPDHNGFGGNAGAYENFIVDELLPFIRSRFHYLSFRSINFAGFSLGALSALDIAWNHPDIFSTVGVISGSLWWRSISKDDKQYDPWQHRMMHHQIDNGEFRPRMKFFFACGELDETEDRNRNGVIDSIDDTIDLMRLLVRKGYMEGRDLYYVQEPNGRHDVKSWSKMLPRFLKWAFATTASIN